MRKAALVTCTGRSRRCRLLGRRLALWGPLALLTLCGAPALGHSPLPDLIEALKLSAYPPGWRPPPFAASTVEGRRVSLADFHGRVVVLNFWATWCVSCLRELPALEQLHRDHAAAGLTVLGVNLQEDWRTIERHGRELGLSFPLVLDLDRKITRAYGVVAVPSTYLIGRDGRPVALAVGDREWGSPPARALIEALLAEPALRPSVR